MSGGFFMRKIIIPLFLMILLVIGCDNTMNTPTVKVEKFLGKYQKMDKEVIKELDYMLEKETGLSKKQKKEYKELLKKQYQNLSYKIISEETNNNHSIVEVEIQVLDYKSAMDKKNTIEMRIKEMKKVTAMTKYKITIPLSKKDGVWFIDEISDDDRQKLHGIY